VEGLGQEKVVWVSSERGQDGWDLMVVVVVVVGEVVAAAVPVSL
jgi:hypothetical protein